MLLYVEKVHIFFTNLIFYFNARRGLQDKIDASKTLTPHSFSQFWIFENCLKIFFKINIGTLGSLEMEMFEKQKNFDLRRV